jgi:hypothetical protein
MVKNEYPIMSKFELMKWIPEIKKENVSERAMKPDGFTQTFLFGNPKLNYPGKSHNYYVERNNFIKRHLAQYQVKPSYRRFLSLVAWAYMPEIKPSM